MRFATVIVCLVCALVPLPACAADESIWIEAEHLQGIRGYCWPGGLKAKTDGHWAVSGPGWAAERVQGGESNFLSIACGADDDKAVAHTEVQIPRAGTYRVWVRFRDNRGCTSRFQVRLTPAEGIPSLFTYGTRPVVEEDNEMKLYWNWAFAWEGEQHEAKLPKGKIKLELLSAFKETECRQIDCIVLTTDRSYRPLIKERPGHPTWNLLNAYDKGIDAKLEPLARRTGEFAAPAAWKPGTFNDKGFLYLWNVNQTKWASDDPKRVLYPYNVADKETLAAFEKKYAGAKDVPIFSDPRIVPTFHGAGPHILATDAKDARTRKMATEFVKWLDANPDRPWALMMNYAPDTAVTDAARENFLKYRSRYVGNVAGENLGYFSVKPEEMKAAVGKARTPASWSRRSPRSASPPMPASIAASSARTGPTLTGRSFPASRSA